MNLQEILLLHAAKYPRMIPQDAVKLLYQSEFGSGHMIENEETAYERLIAELCATPDADAPLRTEPVGGGLVRLHLAGTVSNGLNPRTLTRLFVRAAAPRGSVAGLEEKLTVLRRLSGEGAMPFDAIALDEYLAEYRAAGYPLVRHTQTYRDHYAPAYRLILEEDARYLRLLAAVDTAQTEHHPLCVAIDGRCASGKTSFAERLRQIYGCPVLHMDDFFLPAAQKTPERMAEIGGNVDYQRFAQEVLPHMTSGQSLQIGVFDCRAQDVREQITIPPASMYVVEGSYALHPMLADAYHLKVFFNVSSETQRRRILERNGPEMLRRFEELWIPMEEQYFRALDIAARCDFVFDHQ